MTEQFHRTPEGLSLMDPISDPRLIAAKFPQIVIAYCHLPIGSSKDPIASRLMKRFIKLEQLENTESLPAAETFILKTENSLGNNFADVDRIRFNIEQYRRSLNEANTTGFNETDLRFVRMWFFDRIGYNFHQLANYMSKINQSFVQSVIASMYSDFELGAMESASTRVWHDLSTATYGASPALQEIKNYITGIQRGKRKQLPKNWWNIELEQELSQRLTK